MYAKNEKIYPTYVSKNEGWHYITVKKLSALLRGVLYNIMVISIVKLSTFA